MKKSIFEVINGIYQSIPKSVAAANRLDKAYWIDIGKPEEYKPFTIKDDPEKVAINLPGLYATIAAMNILTLRELDLHNGKTNEDGYVDTLQYIVEGGSLTYDEAYIVNTMANLAWRAQQPLRGLNTDKPLERITRDVNIDFNLLSPEEQAKDMAQIREGAKIILEAWEAEKNS